MNKFKTEQNVTYLFIAHDLSIVRFISDRIGVIYKGTIVEVCEAEELFNFPLHPYTRSLISAIPIPDPLLEKSKVLYSYNPFMHEYSEDKPSLQDIGHGHFVYGNTAEIEEYKRIREEGVPLKSSEFTKFDEFYEKLKKPVEEVKPEEVGETGKKRRKEKRQEIGSDSILDRPVHDTGSKVYTVLSFFLPIVGIILAAIFRKKNYIRNYKKCKKGAIGGFILIGVIIVIFLFFLLLTLR